MPNLPDPPRFLPLSLRVRLLFGDFLHQFGWWCLSGSLIMVLVALRAPDWEEFQMTPENMQTVTARIVSAKPYSSNKHGSGVTYVYRFESPSGGERVEATVAMGGEQKYTQGGTAQIEYLRENPLRSRFPGQPSSIWFWAILSVLLGLPFLGFGIVCAFLLVVSWRDGRYRLRLLQSGLLVALEEVELSLPEPRGPAGHVSYRFTPLNAQAAFSRREMLDHSLLNKITPAGPWHVLYLPEEPEKAQLWELWGQGLKQTASGAFLGRGAYFLYLLTPLGALALLWGVYFLQDTPAARFF